MQCDICFRTSGKEFLCPTDARNILYESRIQTARVLLERDTLDQEITALLSKGEQDEAGLSSGESASPCPVLVMNAEKHQALDRTQKIIAHADELRAKVQGARDEIAKKKASLARKKAELESRVKGNDLRGVKQIEEVERSIRMAKYKWNQGHHTTAISRTFLCGEAAKLYGLKRVRRNSGSEEYRIGGTSIVDLKALNTASPAQISTTLSHIVHLLMLSTHYLAIRLPAEITLPHRDYPLPTIFPIQASYKHTNVPFPGTTPSPSSSNSPTASRHTETPNQPRPRPLFVKKPLPLLATEDPAGYSLFIEAVTLLAYDIAWVCKSQGIPVGEDNNFEDICNMGRNLYNLLIGTRPRPPPDSRHSSNQATPIRGGGRDGESEAEEKRTAVTATMGKYSHGSAHSFLGSTEGTEFTRSWKLTSPIKLADRLKTKLLSEVANAEWEVLDEDAWAVENRDEMGGEGVVVGARKDGERGFGLGMQSFMSMRTVMDAVEMIGGGGGGDGERKPGVNGWTKLKSR